MIVYLDVSNHTTLNVIGVSLAGRASAVLRYDFRYDDSTKGYVLSESNCKNLDSFLKGKAVICWRSNEDLEKFLVAAKKRIKYRVKRNSVILPPAVSNLLPDQSPVTPELLRRTLKNTRITKSELYKLRGKMDYLDG